MAELMKVYIRLEAEDGDEKGYYQKLRAELKTKLIEIINKYSRVTFFMEP